MDKQQDYLYMKDPNRKKYWIKFFLVTAILAVLYFIAFKYTDISYKSNDNTIGSMFKRLFWDPFFIEEVRAELPYIIEKMVETIFIAYAGTLIAALLAVPFAFLAAKNMSGKFSSTGKFILNAIRAFPEIILAIIFVGSFGLGPIAGIMAIGIHSIGMLGKLYSEVIESIDMSVVEALEASGANKLQTIWHGVIPQVIPECSSYAIYRFEIDVRASSVLGIVGAGGIGAPLIIAAQMRDWELVGMILIVIIVVVTIIDFLSAYLRKKIV
ncbi:phosphonate ABC transporter, permease protein PhnE [Lottiidibacillus patelloidae]|uniref:Phosphonate ABC transporter, permease protein PhnE n=1 Tax=Lottiidibacillus patelloidae TaxID=2670334 RepID=A0A263BWS9_9BACI|nr:phosphonate ABC transporter, permease protein PhnE [Lottiidibacillus patelloidae]OZM58189.1 phosphonate ABC transporter, permease protein PhnE [Lottiidibacillus patelloidae]